MAAALRDPLRDLHLPRPVWLPNHRNWAKDPGCPCLQPQQERLGGGLALALMMDSLTALISISPPFPAFPPFAGLSQSSLLS
eukprot:bmy_21435T0